MRLKIRNDLDLNQSREVRLPLVWIAILYGRIQVSLAATTDVQTADDVSRT